MASLTFYWDVPGFFVILQHFRGVFGVSFIIFWGYFRDFFDDLYAKCNFLLLLLSFYCSTINSNWTSTDLRLIPGYLNWIWTWKRGKKSHFFLLLFYYIYDFVVNFYFPNWTEFSFLLFIVLLFPAFNATLTGKMLVRVIFQVRWWPQALFSRCVGVSVCTVLGVYSLFNRATGLCTHSFTHLWVETWAENCLRILSNPQKTVKRFTVAWLEERIRRASGGSQRPGGWKPTRKERCL